MKMTVKEFFIQMNTKNLTLKDATLFSGIIYNKDGKLLYGNDIIVVIETKDDIKQGKG